MKWIKVEHYQFLNQQSRHIQGLDPCDGKLVAPTGIDRQTVNEAKFCLNALKGPSQASTKSKSKTICKSMDKSEMLEVTMCWIVDKEGWSLWLAKDSVVRSNKSFLAQAILWSISWGKSGLQKKSTFKTLPSGVKWMSILISCTWKWFFKKNRQFNWWPFTFYEFFIWNH